MDSVVSLVVSGALMALIVWWFFGRSASTGAAVQSDQVQDAVIVVDGGYNPESIELAAHKPINLVFNRKDSSNCLEEIIIPHVGIQQKLKMGQQNTIQLDAMEPGEYEYSCGMRMYHGKLLVK